MAKVDVYTKNTVVSAAAPAAVPALTGAAAAEPVMTPSAGVAPSVRYEPTSGAAIGTSGGGIGGGSGGGYGSPGGAVMASSAGVSLYKRAQELEQLSRTKDEREKNSKQIGEIETQLSDPRFVTGFGSVGGEEFFSYLNISDSLPRAGGPKWEKWNADMKEKILQMQNADGTWAGHHCITGRVAVTSAAILNLLVDRDPLIQTTGMKKK
jgi:hypothetical protein